MIKRDIRFDSLRGIFLIIMTIDHFGGWFKIFTYQTFGYVSVAEGFVCLSGFVFSIAYLNKKYHFRSLINKSLKRAWFIYKYHILLTIGIPIIFLMIPGFERYWSDDLGLFFSSPGKYILCTMLFLHQPMYMDILSMYFFFVLITPIILFCYEKGYGYIIFIASIFLWFSGLSIDPIEKISNFFCLQCHSGFFNLFSWQLIWVIGTYLGWRRHRNKSFNIVHSSAILSILILSGLFLFFIRHQLVTLNIDLKTVTSIDNLGWLRLANFMILVILLGILIKKIPISFGIPIVEFIGQHSIQVYSFHVFLLYMLMPLKLKIFELGGGVTYTFFVVLVILSLVLPARAHHIFLTKYKKDKKIHLPDKTTKIRLDFHAEKTSYIK